jgi:acetyl-CoA carboxylase carboxyl transferase subunit beta
MAWFKKVRTPIEPPAEKASRVPEGLMVKCPSCATIIYNKDLAANLNVCSKCAHHFRLSASERLRSLFDGEWEEHDAGLVSTDPLAFVDTKPYRKRLEAGIKATGLRDAVIVATGRLDGIRTIVAAMEYAFIGGSMGAVVGEKITRAIERAIDERLPVIIVSCSGGARMMEGILSLMQMARISAALAKLDRAGLPYVSVLTDPTTGGVTASFAMLGDLNIAEPKALIGFAGPRVIEQTIRQKLPEGFQRSEFLLEKGFIDVVVDRRELKSTVARALRFMLPHEVLAGSEAEAAAVIEAEGPALSGVEGPVLSEAEGPVLSEAEGSARSEEGEEAVATAARSIGESEKAAAAAPRKRPRPPATPVA